VRKNTPLVRNNGPFVRNNTPFVRNNTPFVRNNGPFVRNNAPFVRTNTPLVRTNTPFVRTAAGVFDRIRKEMLPRAMFLFRHARTFLYNALSHPIMRKRLHSAGVFDCIRNMAGGVL
jgi:titin